MNPAKTKVKAIPRMQDWGLYVWKTPNGRYVGDGHGNIMNIPAMRYDLAAIARLKQAAAFYGYVEGEAVFMPGVRRVSDMEYSEQKARLSAGMIPSETDYGAYYDAQKGFAAHGDS